MKKLILCLFILLSPVAMAGAAEDVCAESVVAETSVESSVALPLQTDPVSMAGGSCVFACQQEYYQCLLQPEGNPQECREDLNDCRAQC